MCSHIYCDVLQLLKTLVTIVMLLINLCASLMSQSPLTNSDKGSDQIRLVPVLLFTAVCANQLKVCCHMTVKECSYHVPRTIQCMCNH